MRGKPSVRCKTLLHERLPKSGLYGLEAFLIPCRSLKDMFLINRSQLINDWILDKETSTASCLTLTFYANRFILSIFGFKNQWWHNQATGKAFNPF